MKLPVIVTILALGADLLARPLHAGQTCSDATLHGPYSFDTGALTAHPAYRSHGIMVLDGAGTLIKPNLPFPDRDGDCGYKVSGTPVCQCVGMRR